MKQGHIDHNDRYFDDKARREALRDAKLNKISLDEAIIQYDKTMNEYTIWKNRWMRKSITFTEGMR